MVYQISIENNVLHSKTDCEPISDTMCQHILLPYDREGTKISFNTRLTVK